MLVCIHGGRGLPLRRRFATDGTQRLLQHLQLLLILLLILGHVVCIHVRARGLVGAKRIAEDNELLHQRGAVQLLEHKPGVALRVHVRVLNDLGHPILRRLGQSNGDSVRERERVCVCVCVCVSVYICLVDNDEPEQSVQSHDEER